MIDDLKAFMDRLKLWVNQIFKEELQEFPCFKNIK